MANMTFYYARVSTKEQSLDRQLQAFYDLGATDKTIVTDKASGKSFDRPGYQDLKSKLRDGDTLVIKSLDRLGRNKQAIYEELTWMKANGIRLKIMDIPTTMIDFDPSFSAGQAAIQEMVNNLVIEVLATIAEMERANIKARQAEGIAAMPVVEGKKHSAKKGKKAMGRPVFEKPEGWDIIVAAYKRGEMTGAAAIRTLGVSKSTFYKQLSQE